MCATPLTGDVLSELRRIGDPELERLKITDPLLQEYTNSVRAIGLHGVAATLLQQPVVTGHPELREVLTTSRVIPQPDMLRVAQELFGRFGPEISGALLLAALPQSYATELGARTLMMSAGLQRDLVRRVRQTALFLMFVMQRPDAPKVGDENAPILRLWKPRTDPNDAVGRPMSWKVCAALRLYHHAVRRELGDDPATAPARREVPLNQEDLLGMLLTFTVSVFEVLERYGICWTADEQEAYLHLWDVVGGHLGIGSPVVKEKVQDALENRTTNTSKGKNKHQKNDHDIVCLAPEIWEWPGLRPPRVDDTRRLLDQIRARHWIDPGVTSASDDGPALGQRSGRLLTSALLDELAAAMPPSLKLMPITVMRALAPDVVRRRLSLGHNGIVIRAFGQLPKRRNVIGRFTAISTPNPVFGRVLRFMANEVTGRASVHFLKEADYFFPGLEEWSRGFHGDS